MSLQQFTVTSKLTDDKSTTIQATVRVINKLIFNLNNIFTESQQKVQGDSVLLQNIVISGHTPIPHTLGRTLTGWQIVRISGPALIWDTQVSNSDPSVYLQLNSTAKVTVSILVF